MIAQYVSIQFSALIIIKEVIAVTVEWNISDVLTVLNIHLPPGNLIFAMAYAASEEKNRLPTVPVMEVKTVLKM